MFSVVIPAYNCESTIALVLDSVIGQTRVDLIDEIIVINDGSTDRTEEVIKEYQRKNSIIKYFFQENRGVSATRNRGIKAAVGEWVALLDSDDIWKNNKIERQYEIICNAPAIKFLGTEYPLKILIGNKKGLIKLTPEQLCLRYMPTTPSVVFHRLTGIRLGLYDENMKYCEDINFFQKFLLVDSYYVLAENLVEIGLNKSFFSQSGLSSNLYMMHMGRKKNVRQLYDMKLINKWFYYMITILNEFKYLRRKIFRYINKMIYKEKSNREDTII